MSSNRKRHLDPAARSISPPPARRKLSTLPEQQHELNLETRISSPYDPETFNIFSWNVNGVSPFLQTPLSFNGPSETSLRTFLRRHRWPSLLCLQEVKISLKDTSTQAKLQQAANGGAQKNENDGDRTKYKVEFSLPRDRYNATRAGGKVHGVATLVRKDLLDSGIVLSTDLVPWDLEGRVLITKTNSHLAVINGYWVNGTGNPYRDPSTGELKGTRHDHKLRFHAHMLSEARNLESQGYNVVLIGDMNVAPQHIDGYPNLRTSPEQHVINRADFNTKFLGEGAWGVDVFRACHGERRKYTYHPRRGSWGDSCDRVDLVLAGKAFMHSGAVIACDIEDSEEERAHSDHVPLWVSINLARLAKK